VLTGAAGSGKTTVLEYLSQLGHNVSTEVARKIIDEGLALGITLKQIRGDELAFQKAIAIRAISREKFLPHNELNFLDRSLADCWGYCLAYGFDSSWLLDLCFAHRYRQVFFLEALPWQEDYARPAEEERMASLIEQGLKQAYTLANYELIFVPVMPPTARAEFICSFL